MSYSTTDDIKDEFKSINLTAADAIMNSAKVDRFRDEASGLINSFVSNVYKTPVLIANLDAYNMLKKIEIDLVTFRVTKIMNIKKAIIDSNGVIQEILEGKANREAMALLNKISKGELNLPGVESNLSAAFNSKAQQINQQPVMRKNVRQW